MATLSDTAKKTLALFMNPLHLKMGKPSEPEGAAGLNRHWIVDDFLAPHFLPLIRELVEGGGVFEDNLKLAGASLAPKPKGYDGVRGKVDRGTFDAAPEEDRFIRQRRFTGARPELAESRAAKAETFLRRMLGSAALHEWLSELTGHRVTETGGINLKLHSQGDFLRPHSDARPGRKLCAVIYAHETWRPGYDGRFVLHLADGTLKRIDPLPNRMILFDVTQENVHAIESLGCVPEGWLRVNYTAWFA